MNLFKGILSLRDKSFNSSLLSNGSSSLCLRVIIVSIEVFIGLSLDIPLGFDLVGLGMGV